LKPKGLKAGCGFRTGGSEPPTARAWGIAVKFSCGPVGSQTKPQPPRVSMLFGHLFFHYFLALFLLPRSGPSEAGGPQFIEPPLGSVSLNYIELC